MWALRPLDRVVIEVKVECSEAGGIGRSQVVNGRERRNTSCRELLRLPGQFRCA
jgi:hypothetical protein